MSADCSRFVDGVVLDVDGVVWTRGAPTEGAVGLLATLALERIPVCLLTNDCSVGKADRHRALGRAGFVLDGEQLVTAAELTGEWLRATHARRIMYLGSSAALQDVGNDVQVMESGSVDAVVIGDPFACYNRHALDLAARAAYEGATLVAMHRNRRWSDGETWHVDNGFWVAGLEYVTGRDAVVVGKPSHYAYSAAISRLQLAHPSRRKIAFVSDDMIADLQGAKEVGLRTIYFGRADSTPPWVDHAAGDMKTLMALLGL